MVGVVYDFGGSRPTGEVLPGLRVKRIQISYYGVEIILVEGLDSVVIDDFVRTGLDIMG